MRLRIEASLDYDFPWPADVLLALEVAQMPDQRLIQDRLIVATTTPLTPVANQQGIGRRTWTAGLGRFQVEYNAIVEIHRNVTDLMHVRGVPLRDLPGRVIQYLWPSRYCQSDKLQEFATEQFAGLQGGTAVLAIAGWVEANVAYEHGCSDEDTTASDTFQQKKGICRDFAHLMISFCRAVQIPARMVSAYAWNLDPQDFHAVVEVYLDGGWYLVDPTGLAPTEGLVRIGVGRDATDISFMTVFGTANLNAQKVSVERL